MNNRKGGTWEERGWNGGSSGDSGDGERYKRKEEVVVVLGNGSCLVRLLKLLYFNTLNSYDILFHRKVVIKLEKFSLVGFLNFVSSMVRWKIGLARKERMTKNRCFVFLNIIKID